MAYLIPELEQPKEPRTWQLDCPLVYGPLASRRHGLSLGINLLPKDLKVCNFDCLYCQCGRTARETVSDSFSQIVFPSLEEVEEGIASRFRELERMDAARQWQYEPTYLNDVAYPVVLNITVNFLLQ